VKAPVVLWAVTGAWAASLAELSVLRQRSFENGRFDLGNMTQAVWATAHGHPLQVTNLQGEQVSRLASHFDPLIAALAPLWLAWPSPDLLLVAQAVAIAFGALPVFRLARRHLGSEQAALGLALAYLLYPATQWLTLNEFHTVALATPLLLFAFDYLDQDQLLLFAVFALLAMTSKEEIGLVVAGFGAWYAIARGRRLEGTLVGVLGLAASVVAIKVVIPHFRGGESPFASRYGRDSVTHLISIHHAHYVVALLVPLMALPLLAPLALVAAIPEAALNLLSLNPFQSSIRFHYTAGLIPPLVIAAVLGCEKLVHHRPRLLRPIVAALLLVGVGSSLAVGAARLRAFRPTAHDHVAERALRLVPRDAVVSATNTLGAHLSARRRILSFPLQQDATWMAVDTTRLSYLERATPSARARAAYARLRQDRSWHVVFDSSGIVLLRRG
jgi:uncharacterized membrane protein